MPFAAMLLAFVAGLLARTPRVRAETRSAVFAGGCFWCVEQAFDAAPGVLKTTSGYTGGSGSNPTYSNHGDTGHIEAVEVQYDDTQTCYADLLPYFWHNIDPLARRARDMSPVSRCPGKVHWCDGMCDDVVAHACFVFFLCAQDGTGQFCDKGGSYVSVLYYDGADEEALARASKADAEAELRARGRLGATASVATAVRARARLWPAENYHQNYYRKEPEWYSYYKGRCGRVNRLREVWGATAAGSHAFSYANGCKGQNGTASQRHSSLKPGEDGDYSLPAEAQEWIAAASIAGCVILFAWLMALRRCRRERRSSRQHRLRDSPPPPSSESADFDSHSARASAIKPQEVEVTSVGSKQQDTSASANNVVVVM